MKAPASLCSDSPVLDWNGSSWTFDGTELNDSRELADVLPSLNCLVQLGDNVAEGPGVSSVEGRVELARLVDYRFDPDGL